MAYDSNTDLTQGALQQLLGAYDPQERARLTQQRDATQQAYFDILSQPLPDIGPINRITGNYLQNYAKNPNWDFSAMAGAIGGEALGQETRMGNQLLRQQQAQVAQAKAAQEALKESDLMAKTVATTLKGGTGMPTAAQLRTVYTSARNEAAQISKDYQFPTAEQRSAWIEQQANDAVKNYIQNFAQGIQLRGTPEQASPFGAPGLATAAASAPQPTASPVQMAKDAGIPVISGVRTKEEQQKLWDESVLAGRPGKTAQGNPIAKPGSSQHQTGNAIDVGKITLEQRQWLLDNGYTQPVPNDPNHWVYNKPAAPTQVAGAVPSPPLKDVRTPAQQKGYGQEEGKGLFEERKAMTDLYGANSKLMGQLNTLENIYSNPNIPEGQLAEYQQSLRSGLKTLGVEVAPETGITDFAKAIGTSLALTQKNADGKNLLPGAMSNYEDQLLQKMAPTLSLTQEGRVALVQFMKQVAQSNLRIANEATQMASGNKDMLPSGWYQRKERIMLEEMAKLKAESDRIIQQYGGAKK